MNDDDSEGATESVGDPSTGSGDRPPNAAGDGGERSGTDGVTRADGGVAASGQSTDYLEAEVNIFRPSTPFMRDHLRLVWIGFAVWAAIVFGPVTLTAIVPDLMTTQIPGIGFPLHYFLVAIGAPGGALLLSIWYAYRRDQLDERYGIDHDTATEDPGERQAAVDGGRPAGDDSNDGGANDAGADDARGGHE